MGNKSKIEWCDHTASPWHGCSKVSAGCDHCYAAAMAPRNPTILGQWGDDGFRVKSKSFIRNLERWNREGEKLGRPLKVFPSICDPFEDRPELVAWRNEMFEAADRFPWIILILATKRPENILHLWPSTNGGESDGFRGDGLDDLLPLRKNVWLISSAENQAAYDQRAPHLWSCRGLSPVLGWSMEPLLGSIDMRLWNPNDPQSEGEWMASVEGVGVIGKFRPWDWVITGGESGNKARACHPDWFRFLLTQCQEFGIPFFFKQWGNWKPISEMKSGEWESLYRSRRKPRGWETQAIIDEMEGRVCTVPNFMLQYDGREGARQIDNRPGYLVFNLGKSKTGRTLDGREWNEFPSGGKS